MLVFDHASSPPGGYTFLDPSGVRQSGKDLRELIANISAYRATNGLPPGNPHAELEAIYKVEHPHLVTKVGVAPVVHEDPIARWVNRLWRLPPKEKDFAESETTRARLETCAACQYYAPIHKFDITTNRRLTILSVARMTDFGACKAHHWAPGMAALMQEPETQVDAEGCWACPKRIGPESTGKG